MKRIVAYVCGLIADAELAIGQPPRYRPVQRPVVCDSLDHPTYLRRGLVIAGIAARQGPRRHGFQPGVPR